MSTENTRRLIMIAVTDLEAVSTGSRINGLTAHAQTLLLSPKVAENGVARPK